MVYKLRLLPKAEDDYMIALDWYAKQSPEVANRFLTELSAAFEKLEKQPTFYNYHSKPYRRLLLHSFPYKIVFEVEKELVVIHAIFHTSQNSIRLRKRLP